MNWGAVIGAGASLLGGAMASRSSGKHVVPDYAKIRRKAEAAGFNPLTALTSAPGSVVASQNYMGSAIADAGLILADGMAKKAEKTGELQKAREQNAQLKERVQQLTIRPRVGGIYANNVATPSIRSAVGGNDESSSGDLLSDGLPVSGGRPLRGAGYDLAKSDDWSDAEDYETRYGELGSSLIGIPILGADLLKTLRPWARSKIGAEVGPERDLIRFPHSSIPPDQRSAFERINDWRKWWER
ncbi:hypothetical protein CCR90_18235 [Rhodovulum sulfidophilum]|uniref:hypothetical protein n=1 Tax=Rhodovulum sulfidophilum TaxID=35806 RepID=UPI0019128069|nr:hypothetical protein [Rhodovulum sulfidophilum]MBK5925662.1 hypothetical protein [Rhodovulum sulfidophilum]